MDATRQSANEMNEFTATDRPRIDPRSISRTKPNSVNRGGLPKGRSQLQALARQIVECEVGFIDNADFRKMESARAREPKLPVGQTGDLPRHVARDLPAHLVRYCEVPLLSANEEQELFRWMNYYKYRANALRSTIKVARPNRRKLENITKWLTRSDEIRNHVVRANTRLVISIVKKMANELNPFDELLSEGTTCLINVVNKFDFSRGFRFSTYATRSVQRELWRLMQRNHRDRNRYATGYLENFDQETSESTEDQISVKTWKLLTLQLNRILDLLDEREQFIVRSRYGMIGDKSRTFQSLGDELGVCKERVRQLEIRALKKLYSAAKEAGLGKFELTLPRPS